MSPLENKNVKQRKELKICYPEGDCFGEWQEQQSVARDVKAIAPTGEHDPKKEGGDTPDGDPFFGHYNVYF
ncbi:MAG: hypothetical protein LBK07_07210 [Tannerella sp.]|jgi:hypothetical protein|nr:hypothetical protein [Tannerella sp.]